MTFQKSNLFLWVYSTFSLYTKEEEKEEMYHLNF